MRPALSSLLTVVLIAATAPAQTSYPMITHVSPVAVQRGKTSTVLVSGTQNFAGTYKALFEGDGITAEVIPGKSSKNTPLRSVRLKLTVSATAKLGVRDFRLASRLGVSSIGQLVVSEHPVVEEKGDNNTRDKANPITVPGVVCGRIEAAEDVDYFRFSARAGQTMTFEILCARIQDKIHDLQKHADPILTLYDASGRELAANDDFYFADSMLGFTVKKDGDYILQVRDSKYDGDPRWVYALLVTDQPYASHLYPPAVQAGQQAEVELVGSTGGSLGKVKVAAPARPGIAEVVLDAAGRTTNPVTLIVSPLRQFSEIEPNDAPKQATRIVVPCGVNGRMDRPRDVDDFVFAAKKGQALRFEVQARRFGTLLRSSLDSVIEILNATGAVISQNDDAVGLGKDSALTFTPPADGDYTLRIRDLNSKGGPTHVYHVEVDLAKPDFSLRCDGDKAMLGPGSRTAWYVQLTRLHGFAGAVRVDVAGLPAGVTVNPLTIGPGQSQGLLVLSAASDAKIDAVNVSLTGEGERTIEGKDGKDGKDAKKEKLVRPVVAAQEIYFPGGGRGVFDVSLQTVAVTEPGDILDVVVSQTDVVLKPGSEVRIGVEVKRRPGYDKGITLDVLLRHLGRVFGNPLPPGVTIVEGKSKTLLGRASKGYIVLRADPSAAEVDRVSICVLCHVSINFVVKMSYCSPVITLSVKR